MLTKLHFQNFKAWPKVEINFAPITGFFGTNSSGKSSIMQMLLLLKQTREATDRNLPLNLNGQYVKLGTFSELIHKHDESLTLSWSIAYKLQKPLKIADPSEKKSDFLVNSNEIEVSGALRKKGNKELISTSLKYLADGKSFGIEPKREDDSNEYELTYTGLKGFRFLRASGRVWGLPSPSKSYAFPDQARTYYQNASFLSDFEETFESQFDRIYYLGPLRRNPDRDYLWGHTIPRDVGTAGEYCIDAILAATDARRSDNFKSKGKKIPFQELIAHWLKELGLIHSFKIEEIAENSNRYQVKVRVREHSSEVSLTDVGFGISQILPVITLLQYVPNGSTVLLEQPEIHLHPLAQAALADVIINAALHRKVQVVLESHSEHLLLRIQRRIAEGSLKSEDVKFYFSQANNGHSELKELDVDLFGTIKNWPANFMGDAFGETFAAEEARLKTQIKSNIS
jgi:predicted ATPase